MGSDAQYLIEAERALRHEIEAQRAEGGTSVPVEDGVRVSDEPLGATYRFTLPYEIVLPEGAPLEVKVGLRRWPGELLFRDGLTILVTVRVEDGIGLPDPSIPRAELLSEPWFLTEQLRLRVKELADRGTLPRAAHALVGRMTGDAPTVPVEAALPVDGLNEEQSLAVEGCSTQPLWFVWGPPGTGKTSTLGHVVARLVDQDESVVITAHSNVAVDAALLATLKALEGTEQGQALRRKGEIVRAGPAFTEAAVRSGVGSRDLLLHGRKDLAMKQDQLNQELQRVASGRPGRPVADIRADLGELRAELAEAEKQVIRKARVLFCTLSKLVLAAEIWDRRFDAAIVDEVSMAVPPQVVAAGSLATRRLCVLGDFKQLPPIVISEDLEVRKLLGRDAFTAAGVDRAATQDHSPGLTMLREQYRMAPTIRSLISSFAYGGRLRDGDGVAERTAPLADPPPVPGNAVVWRNMAKVGARAWTDADRRSRFNPISAVHAVRDALHLAEESETVVVLAPYRPQVRLLTALLRDAGVAQRVALGTIHRFQGSEGDAVVVDLVDAPPLPVPGRPLRGSPGERLLNVGLSRARGKLVVAGHSALLHQEAEFRPQSKLLHRIARHEGPVDPAWRFECGDVQVDHQPGISDEIRQLRPDDVSAAWVPTPTPPELVHLVPGHAKDAPEGTSAIVAGDRTFLVARLPGGDLATTTVCSARFANALADVAAGSSLTAVRTSKEKAGSVIARHDTCASCGEPAALTVGRGFHVTLDCGSCSAQRWPTTNELDLWAWTVGHICPECGGAMVTKRGNKGRGRPFLSCARYPKCTGMSYVSDLVGRSPVPEAQRPVRAAKEPARARKKAPVVARSRSGHKVADLADFDDYGIDRADAERWLDLSITADHAVDLLAAGVPLEEAERRCQDGEDALDLWRQARRGSRPTP